jgi:hypothetical protein
VDGALAKVHGRQTGRNTVDFPGGQITVGIPGEKYPRDLRTTTLQPRTSAALCQGLRYFCATSEREPNTLLLIFS